MSNKVEFVITRTVNASREVAFQAFTKPEHLKNWWGNKGFEMHVAKLDHLRPGGLFHFSQKNPNGQEMWNKFVYREVNEPEKLVFLNSFSDKDGNTIRAPFPDYPLEILNTLSFTEEEGKTTITMRVGPWTSATEKEIKTFEGGLKSAQQAFAGLFDQLEDYLTSV